MSFTKTGQVLKGAVTSQGALGGRKHGGVGRFDQRFAQLVSGSCRCVPTTAIETHRHLLTSDHHFGASCGTKISIS